MKIKTEIWILDNIDENVESYIEASDYTFDCDGNSREFGGDGGDDIIGDLVDEGLKLGDMVEVRIKEFETSAEAEDYGLDFDTDSNLIESAKRIITDDIPGR